jgi:hypothetical protein
VVDDRGGISFSSYWRACHALLAWQTGGFKKIVISGGDGPGILNFLTAVMVFLAKSLSPSGNLPAPAKTESRQHA